MHTPETLKQLVRNHITEGMAMAVADHARAWEADRRRLARVAGEAMAYLDSIREVRVHMDDVMVSVEFIRRVAALAVTSEEKP